MVCGDRWYMKEPTPHLHADRENDFHPHAANEVYLIGRVSAPAERKVLPSGDELVSFRVVIDRPAATRGAATAARQTVDVIDIACWSARTRRTALNLDAGTTVRVQGCLRRRFWKTPLGTASRHEVEAVAVARVRQPAVDKRQ